MNEYKRGLHTQWMSWGKHELRDVGIAHLSCFTGADVVAYRTYHMPSKGINQKHCTEKKTAHNCRCCHEGEMKAWMCGKPIATLTFMPTPRDEQGSMTRLFSRQRAVNCKVVPRVFSFSQPGVPRLYCKSTSSINSDLASVLTTSLHWCASLALSPSTRRVPRRA